MKRKSGVVVLQIVFNLLGCNSCYNDNCFLNLNVVLLAAVGIIWTVRGESFLNSSDVYSNETEKMRHWRAGALQQQAQLWLNSNYNNDTEGMRAGAEEEQVLRWFNSYNNETQGMRHRRDVGLKPGVKLWGNDIRAQWLKAHNDIRSDNTKILKKKQPTAANMMRMVGHTLITELFIAITASYVNTLGAL